MRNHRPPLSPPALALLGALLGAPFATPAAAQSPGGVMMFPVIMVQPVYMIPVIPVVPVVPVAPVMAAPVVAAPVVAAPVVAAPVMAAPVMAAPVMAAPADDPPGNMLSRLLARIEVKNDVGIGNGPEGPLGVADYRPPPSAPVAPVVAVPVVLVPAGPTAQGIYVVRSGGSLAAVANRTGARLEDLTALNPHLPAGQRLPAGTQVNLPFPWPQ